MPILFTDLNLFECGIFTCLIIGIKHQIDLKPIIYVVLAIALILLLSAPFTSRIHFLRLDVFYFSIML